ncbi:RNA degradosome polyphosphate kinase, partial [bacterium]
IRVSSTLGRFLEHSRVYAFSNDGNEEIYIGSADWMSRNLDARVEAIAPVDDPSVRATLRGILDTMLADQGHVWDLKPDGTWTRRTRPKDSTEVDAQEQFMRQALAAAAPK